MTKDRRKKIRARCNSGSSDNKESIVIELLLEILEAVEKLEIRETKKK